MDSRSTEVSTQFDDNAGLDLHDKALENRTVRAPALDTLVVQPRIRVWRGEFFKRRDIIENFMEQEVFDGEGGDGVSTIGAKEHEICRDRRKLMLGGLKVTGEESR